MRCKVTGTGNTIFRPEVQQATVTIVLHLQAPLCVCKFVCIYDFVMKCT